MSLVDPYWRGNPQKPYATFLTIIEQYLHPESYDLEGLKELAIRTDIPHFVTFREQFREVIANPNVLPEDALFTAAGYDDGSDEAFLARLWRELYGEESPPGHEPARPE